MLAPKLLVGGCVEGAVEEKDVAAAADAPMRMAQLSALPAISFSSAAATASACAALAAASKMSAAARQFGTVRFFIRSCARAGEGRRDTSVTPIGIRRPAYSRRSGTQTLHDLTDYDLETKLLSTEHTQPSEHLRQTQRKPLREHVSGGGGSSGGGLLKKTPKMMA